jgi:glutathione synthase/RimK-type ligase-like ATP-grasp enzyme
LGATAFVKPLLGSRGDFAQGLHDEAALTRYLDEVSRHYDAILIQPIVSANEYRAFLLDDEVLYTARKYPPFVLGDGARPIRDLLVAHNEVLRARGLSPVAVGEDAALDVVPAKGERWEVPGRMNLSAGGAMVLESLPNGAALELARSAARALGLRVAAVDLFTDVCGEQDAIGIIEVNANPSIRLLEQSDRGDLILKIWHHTFSAMGLL